MSFLIAALWAALVLPQAPNLNTLIDGVQTFLAHTSDFSADFEQITINELNRRGVDSGHLYLKRERMMRWEYKDARGAKLFVSDGKMVYFYVAADKIVRRDPVKDAFDDRMPLLFLLGRSNLRDEFTQFRELTEKPLIPGDRVIAMSPKKKGDLGEVKIEVDPVGFRIRRLELHHSDGTGMEFTFSNIDDKTKREPRFFQFQVPPGVEVVDGI